MSPAHTARSTYCRELTLARNLAQKQQVREAEPDPRRAEHGEAIATVQTAA